MSIEKGRTLFLDRDGVVNVLLVNDYVKCLEELTFRADFLSAIPYINQLFTRVIVVTNQQGIAKGICTREQVDAVHRYMLHYLYDKGLTIDRLYLCPHLAGSGCDCRKPAIGMAKQAQVDFPDIDFHHSLMVGDSLSDMQFGSRCEMETLFLGEITPENSEAVMRYSRYQSHSLTEFLKSY